MELNDILIFYKATHGILAVTTTFVLIYVWTRHMRIFKLSNVKRDKDYGLLLFSFAIFCWGLQSILFINQNPMLSIFVLILTNAFALLGLTYFKQSIVNFSNYKLAKVWAIIIVSTSILTYFYSIFIYTLSPDKYFLDYGHIPIHIYTVLTFLILAVFAYQVFKRKHLRGFGVLFCLIIILHCVGYVCSQSKGVSDEYKLLNYYLLLITGVWILISVLMLSLNWLHDLRSQAYSRIYMNKSLTATNNGKTKKSKSEISSEVFNLIMQDKPEEVIDDLLYFAQHNSSNIDELLLIASNLNRLNTQKLRATIDNEEYSLERNKINEKLINYTKGYVS